MARLAKLEEQRVALFQFFDKLANDWDRWAASYRYVITFFGGTFDEDIARTQFEELSEGGDKLEGFHQILDDLVQAASVSHDYRQPQLVGLLNNLSIKLRSADDDIPGGRRSYYTSSSMVYHGVYMNTPGLGMEERIDHLRKVWKQQGSRQFYKLDTYIFDCDGVIWNVTDVEQEKNPDELQKAVVAQVNKLWSQKHKRVLFLTNNSHYDRMGYVKKLMGNGIQWGDLNDENVRHRAEQSIVTAGFTTAKYLKQQNIKRPFVLVSTPGLLEELEAVGITDYISTCDKNGKAKTEYLEQLDKQNVENLMDKHQDVDAVVVGWDFNLTALKIGVAANYLKSSMEEHTDKAMPLITCSADSSGVLGTRKNGKKIRAVGNGAMGHAIANCFDPNLEQIFCGKPSKTLLKLLQDSEEEGGYGVDFKTSVMIGDTIETDIEFANRGDMKSLFVLSGVNSLDDMVQESEPVRQATWILPSFADI